MTAVSSPTGPARSAGTQRKRGLVPSVVSGVLLGVVGGLLAAFVMAQFAHGSRGINQIVVSGYVGWTIFFFIGIGAFNYPLRWGFGRTQPTHEDERELAGEGQGPWRYFRFCTDHKVVGIQYLITVFVLFTVGGIAAFLIRLEQSTPGAKFLVPNAYNTIVGVHGILMIAATVIMITGPFGNFILPIAIGARDMAFPRLNALSYWLLFAAIPVFLSVFALGGFPTGWTGYAPLADQANAGMDAYAFTIVLFGLSLGISAMNIVVTVVTLRAPGMRWNRLPVFVWGWTLSVLLGLVVFPSFMLAEILVLSDRIFGTAFYISALGGSEWLYEQLFWFMGHPEVYVIALPSMAVVAEVVSVFSRKPVYSYKAALGGFMGVAALSMIVWAHHLFWSGANTPLDAPFMLTTELISIPTGLIFLVVVGTFWRGRIWRSVPLLFALGFVFNFIIGGVTGLYLADVPTDAVFHGGMFVVAHFHFTLVGGMVFGFFAAVYYWFPKIFGRRLNDTLGRVHFWLFEIGFVGTFMALFYAGLHGEARWQANIPVKFATPNLIASLFACLLVAAVSIFGYNVISAWRSGPTADADEWGSKSLEWTVPTPVPLENFERIPVVTGSSYEYYDATSSIGADQPGYPGGPSVADGGSAVDGGASSPPGL
ncbi:cytochrome c oxidase subunit I [Ferrimicrobium acidiphilum]|uniref:Cbb3-type cytochrome c oxidase subunit I n=1 Tax=Ferrimicrobium acidiphilum TaxID=121039 RepID=A0ABV3XYH8_9ACTN